MNLSILRTLIREEASKVILQEQKALPTLITLAKKADSSDDFKRYLNKSNVPKEEMKTFLKLYGKQLDRAADDFLWDVNQGDWG